MTPRTLTHEWQRTNPDRTIYLPEAFEGPDAANQHFNVIITPAGTYLAFWTMSTYENAPDQRVVVSRSTDGGETWTPPNVLDGAAPGDPAGTGLASWEFPIVAPGMGAGGADRVYCFYNKNIGINDAREDNTGVLRGRYSDDDGQTWSEETFDLPIAPNAISHPDPAVPANWIVYQVPFTTPEGHVLAAFTRWASDAHDPGVGLLERDSEICFLRFENIFTEPDPARLRVTTWPETPHGLRVPDPTRPDRSIAQEPTVQALADGRLICVLRTYVGQVYYALSSDDGRTWDEPRPLRDRPGGSPLLNPISPCPLYRLADGRYLLLFYNNDGSGNGGNGPADSKKNRYPVWLTIGREVPGEADHPLAFGPPKVLASSEGVEIPGTPGTQVATYPSFTDTGTERWLFYPDRKHYLVARRLTDAWLADCDPGEQTGKA